MSTVLNLHNVNVVRGGRNILRDVSWSVNEGERWVVLGPNGAGKSTLLSIAAARLHPSGGEVEILDETLGAVDVFELRPRIGISSAASATQIPGHEKVSDVVVTAAYAVSGRWKEEYEMLAPPSCWLIGVLKRSLSALLVLSPMVNVNVPSSPVPS